MFRILLSEPTPMPIRVLGNSDGYPKNRVISISATSRVRVELDTCASG
jgi:hypothetical protein